MVMGGCGCGCGDCGQYQCLGFRKTGRTAVCSVTLSQSVSQSGYQRRLGCELGFHSAGGEGREGMKITVILQTTGLALVVSEVWKCSRVFFFPFPLSL